MPEAILTNRVHSERSNQVLLFTSVVKIEKSAIKSGILRAMGSQANLVTLGTCLKLEIATSPIKTSIVRITDVQKMYNSYSFCG